MTVEAGLLLPLEHVISTGSPSLICSGFVEISKDVGGTEIYKDIKMLGGGGSMTVLYQIRLGLNISHKELVYKINNDIPPCITATPRPLYVSSARAASHQRHAQRQL